MLPVIGKVGGSVDRVNGQLDNVDRMTNSAVGAAHRREKDLLEELREAAA